MKNSIALFLSTLGTVIASSGCDTAPVEAMTANAAVVPTSATPSAITPITCEQLAARMGVDKQGNLVILGNLKVLGAVGVNTDPVEGTGLKAEGTITGLHGVGTDSNSSGVVAEGYHGLSAKGLGEAGYGVTANGSAYGSFSISHAGIGSFSTGRTAALFDGKVLNE